MADITMCANTKCPIAYKCYRAKAQPSERQSFSMFEFEFKEGKKVHCLNYKQIKE